MLRIRRREADLSCSRNAPREREEISLDQVPMFNLFKQAEGRIGSVRKSSSGGAKNCAGVSAFWVRGTSMLARRQDTRAPISGCCRFAG